MFKKMLITLSTVFLLISITACSKDSKSDTEQSSSSKKVTLEEFQVNYEKACDKVDQDIVNVLDDADFETVTSDEIQKAYDDVIDEFNKNKKDLAKLEVPSKYEDDWYRLLELNDDSLDSGEDAVAILIELINARDEYLAAVNAGDTVLAAEIEVQIADIQSDLEGLTDADSELDVERDEILDTLGIDKCTE